ACTSAGTNVGFADVRLVSSGDIRLNPQGQGSGNARLSAGGTLTLDAAQVYVTSALAARPSPSDPGFLVNVGSSVTVRGNGTPAPVPFAFGERLTIRARDIVQDGVLRAPLGEIRLEGSQSVTLGPGSVTSTSLEDLHLVESSAGITPNNPFPNLAPNGALGAVPNKAVQIGGPTGTPNVIVGDGAI